LAEKRLVPYSDSEKEEEDGNFNMDAAKVPHK
jgi:hypothetical protein